MARLGTRPIGLTEANAAVRAWHRHHKSVVQHKWSVGVFDAGRLCAVAIVEAPKAPRLAADGALEVTRLATDCTQHAATKALARVTRDALSTGYRRLISYTRVDEPGTCYRAAGWRPTAKVSGRAWAGANKPGRWLPGLYEPSTEIIDRVRWEVGPDAAPEHDDLRHLGRRASKGGET